MAFPVLAAIAGASLLSSILGGLAAGKEKQKERQYAEELRKETINALKPTIPYFQSNALPWLSDALQKAVLGNLENRVGQDILTRWGINPEDYRNVLGFNQPFSQSPIAQKFYPQATQSQAFLLRDKRILEENLPNYYGGKYGLPKIF